MFEVGLIMVVMAIGITVGCWIGIVLTSLCCANKMKNLESTNDQLEINRSEKKID